MKQCLCCGTKPGWKHKPSCIVVSDHYIKHSSSTELNLAILLYCILTNTACTALPSSNYPYIGVRKGKITTYRDVGIAKPITLQDLAFKSGISPEEATSIIESGGYFYWVVGDAMVEVSSSPSYELNYGSIAHLELNYTTVVAKEDEDYIVLYNSKLNSLIKYSTGEEKLVPNALLLYKATSDAISFIPDEEIIKSPRYQACVRAVEEGWTKYEDTDIL